MSLDRMDTGGPYKVDLSEFFPAVRICHMNFYGRYTHGFECVHYGKRRMCIRSGVNDYTVIFTVCCLDLIDKIAFVID